MTRIEESLHKIFRDHRIIFWYDEKEEMKEQYQALTLDGIEKVWVQDNPFAVKYRINKEQPTDKFLLYFTGPKPALEDNWLLDMELAHHVFHTDQEAMFLQELGLGYHLKELVAEHIDFFKAKDRRAKLKEMLGAEDEHQAIRYKMLAVIFGVENDTLTTFIHAHGSAFIQGKDQMDKDLERFNLKDFYWKEIFRIYNYQSEEPSIYGFLMEVFNNSFKLGTKTGIAKDAKFLISLWKNTYPYREQFTALTDRIAKDSGLEEKLNAATLEEVVGDDLFRLTNQKIIADLVHLISEEAISKDKVSQYVKQRENKFWFEDFAPFYVCIEYAVTMIDLVRQHQHKKYQSFQEGIQDYSQELYEIDQAYRKFIWNYRQTKHNNILTALAQKVEKVYTNDWLLTYNDNWQKIVDELEQWDTNALNSQRQFYKINVQPYMDKKQRLFVIISDALRYECGAELNKVLQGKSYFTSSIEPMVASLPSYTQLGMASLLPHDKLSFQNKSLYINADGISSRGTAGRQKTLDHNSGVRVKAIQAEDFMKMSSMELKTDFVKEYDLIYIYHNTIDKTGDEKMTEDRTVDAVKAELEYLESLVQKVFTANGQHMLIIADHGFLYQYQAIDESDFIDVKIPGKPWEKNRRFVISDSLSKQPFAKHFTGSQLNIDNDVDVLVCNSINRLRVSGAGSRYVHGGATLQEIVIPLIKIAKQRQKKTTQVEIDIIKSTDRITTNILAVSFIQSDLVTETVLPREIRASIVTQDGTLLSDQFTYNFDIDEGSERQREVKHRFHLSPHASSKFKNQRVKLILEEPIEGTNKWKLYKDYYYTLNISFTNDFDDF
ncbi:MAG: BREX-1 system phosphatase PglZ type A [Bacteroidota bacterium]